MCGPNIDLGEIMHKYMVLSRSAPGESCYICGEDQMVLSMAWDKCRNKPHICPSCLDKQLRESLEKLNATFPQLHMEETK